LYVELMEHEILTPATFHPDRVRGLVSPEFQGDARDIRFQ